MVTSKVTPTISRKETGMSRRNFWKWTPVVLSVMVLIAFGCAKKQEVKSTDTAATGPSAPATEAPPQGIATETLKPGEPARESERLAAAEAGAAVTREIPSPFQDI